MPIPERDYYRHKETFLRLANECGVEPNPYNSWGRTMFSLRYDAYAERPDFKSATIEKMVTALMTVLEAHGIQIEDGVKISPRSVDPYVEFPASEAQWEKIQLLFKNSFPYPGSERAGSVGL